MSSRGIPLTPRQAFLVCAGSCAALGAGIGAAIWYAPGWIIPNALMLVVVVALYIRWVNKYYR